jgi:hypothetical protein
MLAAAIIQPIAHEHPIYRSKGTNLQIAYKKGRCTWEDSGEYMRMRVSECEKMPSESEEGMSLSGKEGHAHKPKEECA